MEGDGGQSAEAACQNGNGQQTLSLAGHAAQ
jgi:hypothetical protein